MALDRIDLAARRRRPPRDRGRARRWAHATRLLCLLALGLLRLAAVSPSSAHPAPGTLQDPRDLYDLERCTLELTILPGPGRIEGTATWILRARDALDEVVLDLGSSLNVDSAWTSAAEAQVDRPNDEQAVFTLPRRLLAEERDTLRIRYSGRPGQPDGPGTPFFDHHGEGPRAFPLIVSPAGIGRAHTWWPCKESFTDKALVRVLITAPSEYQAVSCGGLLQREEHQGAATTTFETVHPIAPHEMGIALSNYAEWTETYHSAESGRDIPLTFHAFPEDSARARGRWAMLGQQRRGILATLEARLGPYPFADSTGTGPCRLFEVNGCQSVPRQTAAGIGQCFLGGGFGGDVSGEQRSLEALARLVARQWFGASVSAESMADLWLEEGFAAYAAVLSAELRVGAPDSAAVYRGAMDGLRPEPSEQGPAWQPDLVALAPDSAVARGLARRGAWSLHMLRWALRQLRPGPPGANPDETFFRLLRALPGTASLRFAQASTADVIRSFEEGSGLDLRWFFTPWIYGTGRPALAYDWSAAEALGGSEVTLHLEQTQEVTAYPGGEPWPGAPSFFPSFWEIRLHGSRGDSASAVVQQTARFQDLTIPAAFPVIRLSLDPDGWVLHDTTPAGTPGSAPSLIRILPSPAASNASITYRVVPGAPLDLDLYDAAGRLIRRLVRGDARPGTHLAEWDGRFEDARPAPSGVYFLRVSQGRSADGRTLVLVRR